MTQNDPNASTLPDGSNLEGETAGEPQSSHSRDAAPSVLEQLSYGTDLEYFAPETESEVGEIMERAIQKRALVVPSGHGCHAYLGVPPQGSPLYVLSLRNLHGILQYQPDDFTVSVRAGTPLVELQKQLAENGQEIPVDFARSAGGTVGGWVASTRCGPRRTRHGTLRNYLIGAQGIRATHPPQTFRSGGMVVKNVAGYDVGKFMIGALGTAGVFLSLNFKLRQLPPRRSFNAATFAHRREAWSFCRAVRGLRVEPLLLTLLNDTAAAVVRDYLPSSDVSGYVVVWAFEGNETVVRWQEHEVGRLLEERDAPARLDIETEKHEAILDTLVAFEEPLERGDASMPDDLGVARLGGLAERAADLEATIAAEFERCCTEFAVLVDALAGTCVVRWRVRPDHSAESLDAIRQTLQRTHAHGQLLFLPPGERANHPFYNFGSDPSAGLAARVRRVFDPAGVLASQRLLGDQLDNAPSSDPSATEMQPPDQ